MELTTLDTDLLRLAETLSELIAMGLVVPSFYREEEGWPTRYRHARPGDDEEEEEEAEAPARAHVVSA